MSSLTLMQQLNDLPADEPLDWRAFSKQVDEEFCVAATSEERSNLLAVRATAIDLVIRQLELLGEQLEKFTDACELEYKRLIVRETLVGGSVSYEAMLHVTDREIAAGRMSDDYALRVIALEESPDLVTAGSLQPAEDAPGTTSALTKLKHWLHID